MKARTQNYTSMDDAEDSDMEEDDAGDDDEDYVEPEEFEEEEIEATWEQEVYGVSVWENSGLETELD